MNASEARSISREANIIENSIRVIDQLIIDACYLGKFSVCTEILFDHQLQNHYEKLGYKVANNIHLIIGWWKNKE